MLSCSDYSSVTRNLFTAIELRANDYSSVTRKSLHGEEIGKIGCFARGEACVRCVRAIPAHQFRRTWKSLGEAVPRVNGDRAAGNRVVGRMR